MSEEALEKLAEAAMAIGYDWPESELFKCCIRGIAATDTEQQFIHLASPLRILVLIQEVRFLRQHLDMDADVIRQYQAEVADLKKRLAEASK